MTDIPQNDDSARCGAMPAAGIPSVRFSLHANNPSRHSSFRCNSLQGSEKSQDSTTNPNEKTENTICSDNRCCLISLFPSSAYSLISSTLYWPYWSYTTLINSLARSNN